MGPAAFAPRVMISGMSHGAIGKSLGISKEDTHNIAGFLRREVERGRLELGEEAEPS